MPHGTPKAALSLLARMAVEPHGSAVARVTMLPKEKDELLLAQLIHQRGPPHTFDLLPLHLLQQAPSDLMLGVGLLGQFPRISGLRTNR
jgi:hypothetical protein